MHIHDAHIFTGEGQEAEQAHVPEPTEADVAIEREIASAVGPAAPESQVVAVPPESVSARPPEELRGTHGVALGARAEQLPQTDQGALPKRWLPVTIELDDESEAEPKAPPAESPAATTPEAPPNQPPTEPVEPLVAEKAEPAVLDGKVDDRVPDEPAGDPVEPSDKAPTPEPEALEPTADNPAGGSGRPPEPPTPSSERPEGDDEGNGGDEGSQAERDDEAYYAAHFTASRTPWDFAREEREGIRRTVEATPTNVKVTEPNQKVPLYTFDHAPDPSGGFETDLFPQVNILFLQAGAKPAPEDYESFRRADGVTYDPRVVTPTTEDMPNAAFLSPITLRPLEAPMHVVGREHQQLADLQEAIRQGAPLGELREHATEAVRAKVAADNSRAYSIVEFFKENRQHYWDYSLGVVTDILQANVVDEIERELKPYPLRIRTLVDNDVAGLPTPQASATDSAAFHMHNARGAVTRATLPDPVLDRVVLEQTLAAYESPRAIAPPRGLWPAQRAVAQLTDEQVQDALKQAEQLKASRLSIAGRGLLRRQMHRLVRQYTEPAN